MRCSSGSGARVRTAGGVPPRREPDDPAGCSLTVPQLPHAEHRPDHCAEGRSQFAHTNNRFTLPTGAL